MRRTAYLLLVAMTAGCAKTTLFETPTSATSTATLLREFSSQILPGGSASRTFDVTANGPIAVTLTSTMPAGVSVGLGVGIPRSDGSCALSAAVQTAAGSAAQISASAESGSFCAKVYDAGTLTQPLSFTISISRP